MPSANDAVWLSVLPDMKGFGPALAKGVGKEADTQGQAAGGRFGKSMLAGLAAVGGTAAVGATLMAGITAGMDAGRVRDKLAAQLNLSAKDSERAGQVAGRLYRDAYGDSLEGVSTAVGAVMTSIDGMAKASSKELEGVTAKALDFSTAFEVDVQRAVQVTGQMITTGLAPDATQAFDLITAAAQKVPAALREDLLDATDEYGQFFSSLGFSGEQAMAMLVDASEDGMYGIDKMGDAIKEFTIRGTDMSKATKDAYGAIGYSREEVGKLTNDLLAGGPKAQKATQEIVDGLLGIKDPGEQAASAIALFGTPLEDLNTSEIPGFLTALQGTSDTMADFAGRSEKMGDTLNDNFSTRMEGWKRSIMGFVQDGLMKAADWGSRAWTWVSENQGPVAAFAAVVGTLAAVTAAHSAVMAVSAAGGMAAWIAQTRIAAAVTKVWTAVQWAFNAVMAANPIALVILGLVALGAALVVAYKKSDTFREVVDKAWAKIKSAVSTAWEGYIKPALHAFGGFITGTLMPIIRRLWENVIRPHFQFIGAAVKFAWNNVIKPIFQAWWAYISNVLIPVVKFIWEKAVKPVMTWVGEKIVTTWNNVIKPAFNALKDFITDKVVPGFKRGVELIGNAWDGLKNAAKAPINFVIGTVYNDGIRRVFNSVAEKLGSDARLPFANPIGGGSAPLPKPTPGPRQMPMGGAGRLPAMGGPLDWAKRAAGKGGQWVGGKFSGMVNGLLGGLGNSPWAQLAGSAARKVAGLAGDWLAGKAEEEKKKSAGPGIGKVGAAGRVLPAGSYSIGMPYLGYPGHYGADYPAPAGTPVFSPWPGRVTATYDLPGSNAYNDTPYRSYGRVVKVTHDNGLSTLYAHLTDRIGSTGPIAAGQQVGTVGTTGNSTGNHLHFEVRRGGAPFNPASLGIFDKGGWLMPGMGGVNLSRDPEPVFTGAQWGILKGAFGGVGKDKDGKRKSGARLMYDDLVDMRSPLPFLQKQQTAAETMLEAVRALREAADQQKSAAQAQYDAVKQSVVGALSPDLFGGGTLASFDKAMRGKLANNLGFEQTLQALVGAGLDGALFDEVAATGNLKFAQQLLGVGAGGIAEYERLFAEADAAANRSGDLAAAHNGRAADLARSNAHALEMLRAEERAVAELEQIKIAVHHQGEDFAEKLDGRSSQTKRTVVAAGRGKGRPRRGGGRL